MKQNAKVITYDPRYKEFFKTLNLEWIEKYFRVEKKDIQQVENPETCLAEGGEIFFVLVEQAVAESLAGIVNEPVTGAAGDAVNKPTARAVNEIVAGTCAMFKVGDNSYELAKMAVSPDFQGHGFGDLLMISAENWARAKGAKEVFMLSNTVLEPAIKLYQKHGYVITHLGPHPDYERCNIELKKELFSKP